MSDIKNSMSVCESTTPIFDPACRPGVPRTTVKRVRLHQLTHRIRHFSPRCFGAGLDSKRHWFSGPIDWSRSWSRRCFRWILRGRTCPASI